MSRQCGYCLTHRDDVTDVISSCPVHGDLREAAACAECIADPSRPGNGVHVHSVIFMGQGCEQRITLRPRTLLRNPPYRRLWSEGGWRVAVQPSRSGKRYGYALHGPDGSLYVSDHRYGSPDAAVNAGIADARSCAVFLATEVVS